MDAIARTTERLQMNKPIWLDARWIEGHPIESDWPSRGGAQRVVCADHAEAALRKQADEIAALRAVGEEMMAKRMAARIAPCTPEQIAAIVRAAEHRAGYIRWLAEKLRKTNDEAIRRAAADELDRLVS